MFAFWQWEWRCRFLVGGELLGLAAAVLTIPFYAFGWPYGTWLLIMAAIISCAALLWYSFDMISCGELPLTGQSAVNIRRVVIAMQMEEEGLSYDWGNISEEGAIPMSQEWFRSAEDSR